MKRAQLLLLLSPLLMMAACSHLPFGRDQEQEAEAARRAALVQKAPPPEYASDGSKRVEIGGVEIERVEFRPGVSSVTVENMARKQGCTGGPGAGLVSEPGPAEVYRMMCGDGRVFLARCELRQCRQLSLK